MFFWRQQRWQPKKKSISLLFNCASCHDDPICLEFHRDRLSDFLCFFSLMFAIISPRSFVWMTPWICRLVFLYSLSNETESVIFSSSPSLDRSIKMERGNEFKAYFSNILVRGPSNFVIEKLRWVPTLARVHAWGYMTRILNFTFLSTKAQLNSCGGFPFPQTKQKISTDFSVNHHGQCLVFGYREHDRQAQRPPPRLKKITSIYMQCLTHWYWSFSVLSTPHHRHLCASSHQG